VFLETEIEPHERGDHREKQQDENPHDLGKTVRGVLWALNHVDDAIRGQGDVEEDEEERLHGGTVSRNYTSRVKALMYWVARVALFFAALLAEWALGWRHWTAALGAVVLAWFVTYAMFGPIHDIPSQRLERALSQRTGRGSASGNPGETGEGASPIAKGSRRR
jgi:hypothetical protein